MPESPLVLVTGATGFVGRHLCAELVRRGFGVRGGFRGQRPISGDIEWIEVGELGSHTNWEQALTGVSHVVHLAALAHQVGKKDDYLRLEFWKVNVEGTKRLLEQVVASGLPGRFCFVSSTAAICSISETLITDNTPCAPEGAYGQSKLAAENLVQSTLTKGGQSWTIIRPTLVYGPGNPGNMARLLRLIRTHIPLPLASIKNRRNFLFVGNLVDVLIRSLHHPGADGQVLSINDGCPLSTPDLVRMIGRISNHPVRLFAFPLIILKGVAMLGNLPSMFFGRSIGFDTYSLDRLAGSHEVDACPSFAKIEWKPPFTIEEGLHQTIAHVGFYEKGDC